MNSKPDEISDVAKTLKLDQPSRRGKRLKQIIFATLLAGVMAAAFVIWRETETSNSVQYKTQEAQIGNLTVTVTATGTLKSTNQVDVGSELSGTIKSIEADYNDKVKAGQILARLDTLKLEAQATQSRASLESYKAKVLQTQATVKETRSKLSQLKRVWEISNKKVPSQSELDAAEAALDRAVADEASARAAVSQAQATLEANETDLSKAVIRSPIDGVVLTRSVEPGQTVAATMTTPTLFTLAADLKKMELHVNVDEADVGKIKEGQKASFTVAAYPNRNFEARIIQTRFGSSTTSGVVTYETVLKVDNSDLSLRPGMTATANIMVKKVENAVLIPSAALRFSPPVQEEEKSTGSLISSFLPHPPSRPKSQQPNDATANKLQQRVYVLKDKQLSPVSITIGSTSQGLTEVVAGDIRPGTAVVVDVLTGGK
jgi:HlyD family secretion protein